MNEIEIFHQIESGTIQDLSLEDLTRSAEFCLLISEKTTSVLAVTVAKVRRDHITDTTKWVDYCKSNFNLEGSYLHHIHKVGKMLLSVTCYTPKVYTTLFNLDFDKQRTITQIPVEQLETFLKIQTKKLTQMTRAEVRAAVSVFLGKIAEVARHQAEQQSLPGFDKWLDNCSNFEPGSVVNAVTCDDTAQKSLSAGCLLLAAAIDYQLRRNVPDTLMLQNIKAALLDEIQSIENVLAGSTEE